MAKVHFNLKKAPVEFQNGFVAALQFLSQPDVGPAPVTVNFVQDNCVGTTIPANDDNVTMAYKGGKIVFDAVGVEE